MRKYLILSVVISLLIQFSAIALAAGDQYVVIKDKNGVCKVLKTKGKTPKTIAGPFPSKKEAESAKARKCPKPK
jgi:hypothetical protein